MTVLLDSWAILEYLKDRAPAAAIVEEHIEAGKAHMSWLNLGEVYYILRRSHGENSARDTITDLRLRIRCHLADPELILSAAELKSQYRMSYADAFAAATALQIDATLLTGDPELLIPNATWKTTDLRHS